MKTSQVALSVVGTIAVAGYLAATEFPFWERWTKSDKSSSKPKSVATKTKTRKPRKPRKTRESADSAGSRTNSATTGDTAVAPDAPAKPIRSGSGVYWLDLDCDCQESHNMLLETVELTSDSTIFTILNANRRPIAAYPPGDDDAQYLLEWRYVGDHRPRLDLRGLEDIAAYPETSSPLHFKLIFPRIADEVAKVQVTGHSTSKLDYFKYASVEMIDNNKMSREDAERYDAYRRCGFDGVARIAKGHDKIFSAHTGMSRTGFTWSTSSGLAIQGSSRKDTITVRAEDPGTSEVCLKTRVDGESCRYCQDVDVSAADKVEPDFSMKTCGGIPSKSPHWQFAITKPVSGASYTWEVSQGHILKGSKNKSTLIMRTNYRPSKFTVTLHTVKGGEKNSYSREFHTLYSCLEAS